MQSAQLAIEGIEVASTVEHQENGIDRIEFTLPESVLPGCYVRVSVNGFPVSISVGDASEAPGSPCRHPLGLSRQDLLQLDRGGRVPVAIMSFGIGIASVAYVDVLAGDVFRIGLQQQSEFGCSGRRVSVYRGSSRGFLGGPLSPPNSVNHAVLTAPDGTRYESAGGYFEWLFGSEEKPLEWIGGDWQLSLAEKPLLTAPIRSAPKWIKGPDWNRFSRFEDLTVEWQPEGYSSREYVSFRFTTATDDPFVYFAVSCQVPASSGRLTVPSSLMRDIPAAAGPGSLTTANITFNLEPTFFSAPGGRYGLVQYSFGSSMAVVQ